MNIETLWSHPLAAYLRREALHTAFGVGVAVVVALAADLNGVGSFEDVTWAGVAANAGRAAATAFLIGAKRAWDGFKARSVASP
jgi:hypothetical protein